MTPKQQQIEKQLAALRGLLEDDIAAAKQAEKSASTSDNFSIDDSLLELEELELEELEEPGKDTAYLADEPVSSAEASSIPVALKSIQPGDFLNFKKHKNTQVMFLIQQYLKKHGKPSANSPELEILKKAINRILSKGQQARSQN